MWKYDYVECGANEEDEEEKALSEGEAKNCRCIQSWRGLAGKEEGIYKDRWWKN